MKKNVLTKFFIALFCFFAINASLSSVKAQTAGDVVVLIEAIIDAACPETPQNRCKQGTCQSGACISFRPACSGSGGC